MCPADGVRRTFQVLKDDGSLWDLNYTSSGTRWVRRPDDPASPLGSSSGSASSSTPFRPSLGVPNQLLGVIDTATQLASVWETRQQRLRAEAASDELRRTQWLNDMIGRWGVAHENGDRVDLVVSDYLAREARGMMALIESSTKVAVPQSLLYEMASIQGVVRMYRLTLADQFTLLLHNSAIDVQASVAKVMPGHKLDENVIRSLAVDPEVEWEERLQKAKDGGHDDDFDLYRSPQEFQKRLLPATAVATPTPDLRQMSILDRLLGTLTNALPSLWPLETKVNQKDLKKRDQYRELSLFPAEVARARALTAAWLATDEIVTLAHGKPVVPSIGARGVEVALGPGPTALQLEG